MVQVYFDPPQPHQHHTTKHSMSSEPTYTHKYVQKYTKHISPTITLWFLFQRKSRHTLVIPVFINPLHPRSRVPLLVYYIATHSKAQGNSSTSWMAWIALNREQMWGAASPLILTIYSIASGRLAWSVTYTCGFQTIRSVTRDNMQSIEYACTQAITSLCSTQPLPSLQVWEGLGP